MRRLARSTCRLLFWVSSFAGVAFYVYYHWTHIDQTQLRIFVDTWQVAVAWLVSMLLFGSLVVFLED